MMASWFADELDEAVLVASASAEHISRLADLFCWAVQSKACEATSTMRSLAPSALSVTAASNARRVVAFLRDSSSTAKVVRAESERFNEALFRAFRAEQSMSQRELDRLTALTKQQADELAAAARRSSQLEDLVIRAAEELRGVEGQYGYSVQRHQLIDASTSTSDAGWNTSSSAGWSSTTHSVLLLVRSSQMLVLEFRRQLLALSQLALAQPAVPVGPEWSDDARLTIIGLHAELADAMRQLASERAERLQEAEASAFYGQRVRVAAATQTDSATDRGEDPSSSFASSPPAASFRLQASETLHIREENDQLREEHRKLVAMLRVLSLRNPRRGAVMTAEKSSQATALFEELQKLPQLASIETQTVATSAMDLVTAAEQELVEQAYNHLQRLEQALYSATAGDSASRAPNLVKGIVEEMAAVHQLIIGRTLR
jgi:hypothetical protein